MANIISEPIMRLYRYVAGKWAKSAEVNEEMDMFVDSHNNVVTDLNALKNQQDINRSDLQNQITTNKNDSESRDANLQSQITTNKNDSEARDTNLQNQINSLSSTKADKAEIYTKEEINSENGANNIGNKPLVLGGTNKLQPTLEWLKSQIDKTALGQIPDGSLTEIKMANEMKKDIEGGVASYDRLHNLSSQMADLVPKTDFNEHKADEASQTELGHIKLDGLLKIGLNAEKVGGKTANDFAPSTVGYVAGYYTGDNQSTRTINLGFTPKAIILNRTPMASYWGVGTSGISVTGNSDDAVVIVSNGFRVSYNTNNGGTNDKNNKYNYIAFR